MWGRGGWDDWKATGRASYTGRNISGGKGSMNISFLFPLSGRAKMKGCHGEAWSCRGRKKKKKKMQSSQEIKKGQKLGVKIAGE